MITPEEISSKASEFDVGEADIQRDYVLGWFLVGIYSDDELANLLFLKGGNALRKGYFESTRYSRDLDFGTESDIDQEHLRGKIDSVCDFVSDHAGVTFVKDRNRVEEKFKADDEQKRFKVFEVRVYFQDFFGGAAHIVIKIQLDITRFDKLYLPVQSRQLIHPYSDAGDTRIAIKCAKLEEILAAKLKCLLQRQHSPDLFDYVYSVFVDDSMEVSRGEVVRAFLKRTIFEPSPGVVKGLLLGLPLEIFKGYWNMVCPRQSLVDFDDAIEFFKRGVEDLFGQYPDRGPQFNLYLPAEFRNPIMAAGRSQTLILLTYSGVQREVEPYSLVYKKPKSGSAREYFYGYDRTGGRSSGPSIKSFLPHKIQAVDETEEKFEPRFPIELAKAGEPTGKGYFAKPFSQRRRSRTSSRRRTSYDSGIRYVVQCSFCGRQFERKTRSTKMRKHKDKYGNDCRGRRGYLVDTIY